MIFIECFRLFPFSDYDETEDYGVEKKISLSVDTSNLTPANQFSELSDFDVPLNRIELYKRAR